jgi:putative glutamine amidotransferase
LILPTKETAKRDNALKDFLQPYQGVLLPGGVDIEPKFYGEKPHKKLGKNTDPELDEIQLAIALLAMKIGRPTLAICRGLQIMGVAVGFGLYQDLPSERPSKVNHDIREPKDKLAHEVDVIEDSHLARLSGSKRFLVNSRHHQAIKEFGTLGEIGPFKIVARAPDGVVEGLELPSPRFVVAVQWHPENLFLTGNPQARGLLRGFIKACR